MGMLEDKERAKHNRKVMAIKLENIRLKEKVAKLEDGIASRDLIIKDCRELIERQRDNGEKLLRAAQEQQNVLGLLSDNKGMQVERFIINNL